MPVAEPGRVMPRTKRISRTAYGKRAVNQTTCMICKVGSSILKQFVIYGELGKWFGNSISTCHLSNNMNHYCGGLLTLPEVLMPFHREK